MTIFNDSRFFLIIAIIGYSNRLGIPREVLEESLINYEGTLLFVSHDRYFVDKIATCIGEIENKKFKMYDFDYEGYKQEKQRLNEALAVNLDDKKEKLVSQNKEAFLKEKELQRAKEKHKRDIGKLEDKILETENRIIELEKLLNTFTDNWDLDDYNNKYNEYIRLKDSIEDMYTELEKLHEEEPV
jgi:ATP-binding cassette subfamily F protein 3